MGKNKKAFYYSLFILSCLALLLPLFFQVQFRQFQSLGIAGVFLISLLGSATMFLPSTSLLSVGVAARLYDPVLVILASSIGSALGEVVSYYFGKSSREVFRFSKHKLLSHLGTFTFKKYGSYLVFLFALIPNPLVDGIGIIAGAFNYSLKRYLFLVLAGRLLRNILLVLALKEL